MAASKVNIKFVVILGAVLLMVFGGVAGAFVFIKLKSGDRYARMGDAAAAKGDIDAADRWYARAVGKDQSRVDWLTKWRDVRRKKVPKTQSAYQEDYVMYVGLLRTLAAAKRTDVAAHRDYLEELYQQGISAMNVEGHWKMLITETESAMRYFEPEKPAGLRRYRGVSTMALVSLPTPAQVSDEQFAQAREDLEASLKAEPQDSAAANSLCGWHRIASKKAKDLGKTDEATAERAASVKVIDDLLAADPSSPFGKVQKLLLEAAETELLEDSRRSVQDVSRARAAAIEALRPKLASVAMDLKGAEPSRLTMETVARFAQLAMQMDPKNGPSLAREVAERALSGSPGDAELMWLRTHATLLSGEPEKALEQYQAIIELPNKAVSLAGMRLLELRTRAMFLQTSTCLSQALRQPTPEAQAKSMEQAKKYREQLARNVPEHSPEMLLIDGKTKFIERDYRGAQQSLSEFLRAPGQVGDQAFDAYLYLADIAQRNNELGLARQCLEHLVTLRPGAIEPMMMLATLMTQMQQPADALRIYERVLDLDPGNETAAKNVPVLRALVKGDKPLSDPIMQAMVDAQRAILGTSEKLGDEQEGIKILEEAIAKHGADPRLEIALARIYATRGDSESAIQALEAGLTAHPEDESLKAFMTQVKSSATLEGMLALIDQSQASAADKLWLKVRAYTSYSKTAEADAALDALAKAAPGDPRVVEALFARALVKKDIPGAQALADQAAKTNADSAEGDTFRARMLMSQGDLKGAATVLQRAADRQNANQPLLRTLGALLLQIGRQEDGLAMMRRALELNPGDVQTIKAMVKCLDRVERQTEALAVARGAQMVAQRDPEFMDDWLNLEAAAGNREFATTRREQLYARDKKNLQNGAALADLYMDAREWDKARALIDELRKGNEANVRLGTLAARWHADRADLEAARQTFVDLIAAVQAKQTPMPPEAYMAFGQFMLRYNRVDVGLAALKQAERLQDTKTMSVSLAVGETLLGLARWGEAEQSFRKVVEAGVADPQKQIRKRLIETLVQQRKLEEADKEFAALGSMADEDVELLAQRSFTARLRGDMKRAREILDQAVSRFPKEPLPYLRRARILMLSSATVKDALADLDTAINLRPGMWQAYRTRAQLLLDSGRVDEGLADLKLAAESNPALDGLRLEQIDELLRRGRESEAVDAAEAALKPRPNDVRLMAGIAERFAAAGRWARAQRYAKQVWLQVGDASAAEAYVEVLLSSTPPGFAEAAAVLATPKLELDKSASLLMARARLARRQGKEEAARTDTASAFRVALADPATLPLWVTRLKQVFPQPTEQLAALKAMKYPTSFTEWMALQQAVVMLEDSATRPEAIKALKNLLESKSEKSLRVEGARVLSLAYAQDKDFEQALAVTRAGLDLSPEDMMFNNNAADFLSEKLNRPAEGLPFVEKAVKLAPRNEQVQDTLAGVYWRMGKRAEAMKAEGEALRLAQNEADKANWGLKLGRWKLEAGDRDGAVGQLNTVRELLTDAPRLVEEYKPKVDQLEKDIQAAK